MHATCRRFSTVSRLALEALAECDARSKARKAIELFQRFEAGEKGTAPKMKITDQDEWPEMLSCLSVPPGRPRDCTLVSPKEMPSHKRLKISLNLFLVHSIAHVELNAIDLALDMVARWSLFHLDRSSQTHLLPDLETHLLNHGQWLNKSAIERLARTLEQNDQVFFSL